MDEKTKHPACAMAEVQAAKDHPGLDTFKARIVAIDLDRFVVGVHCDKNGWDLFPHPPEARYSVSRDLSVICRLD